MSTAILISGQLRTFARCWPTQRWHVLRHFEDPHFFITVQDGPGLATDLAPLYAEYGSERVHLDERTDPDLSAQLTPEIARAYHLAPYANAAPAHQLLMQHWYQNECWKSFCAHRGYDLQEQRHNIAAGLTRPEQCTNFDTIIRLRGDLWFHDFEWPPCGWAITAPDESQCFTPRWGEFGGINDRFAVMGPVAAKYYFTVYEAIPELLAAGCPFHPESLVAANLERGGVSLRRTLKTFFSTERLDGSRRWPEITPMDIINAAGCDA